MLIKPVKAAWQLPRWAQKFLALLTGDLGLAMFLAGAALLEGYVVGMITWFFPTVTLLMFTALLWLGESI